MKLILGQKKLWNWTETESTKGFAIIPQNKMLGFPNFLFQKLYTGFELPQLNRHSS